MQSDESLKSVATVSKYTHCKLYLLIAVLLSVSYMLIYSYILPQNNGYLHFTNSGTSRSVYSHSFRYDHHDNITTTSSCYGNRRATPLIWQCDTAGIRCNRKVPHCEPTTQKWQAVVADQLFVYSAYIDRRPLAPPALRAFTLVNRTWVDSGHLRDHVHCVFWGRQRCDTCETQDAHGWTELSVVGIERIWGVTLLGHRHENRRFFPIQLQCDYPTDVLLHAVSLVYQHGNEAMTHRNPIMLQQSAARPVEHNFTLCLSPIHSGFNDVFRLVETLELNLMFGVGYIIAYNYSMSNRLIPFLQNYISKGVLEVIQWDLPVRKGSTHWYGQNIAQNDCLYRTANTSKHTVFTDLDEVIVPKVKVNWGQMMDLFKAKHSWWPNKIGQYMFHNVFFPTNWPTPDQALTDFNQTSAEDLHLTSLILTRRTKTTYPYFDRSKIIVDPKVTSYMIIHFAKLLPGYLTYYVPETEAALYHYRKLPSSELKANSLIYDTYLHKYAQEITNRTSERHRQVKDNQP